MTNSDIIYHARLRLPLPSETKAKYQLVPVSKHLLNEFYNEKTVGYGYIRVEFEREYISGICVGWKCKSIH